VKNWVNGSEGTTLVGLTAAFGASLPATVNEARKAFSVLTDPLDCCSNVTTKVQFRLQCNLAI
jgi:signal peptide peptidase-like protein 2B